MQNEVFIINDLMGSLDHITNQKPVLTIVFTTIAANQTLFHALSTRAPSCILLWSIMGGVT